MAPTEGPVGLRVRVRMYRQGFGDCFLLTFSEKGKSTHMLIDCGVHASHPGGAKRIHAVVNQIKKETGGNLGVLAVTHEHWDHVSGFHQARETFKSFKVGESWSAWTENPDDTEARRIRGQYKKSRMALGAAIKAMGGTSPAGGDSELAARKLGLDGLMGFVGPLGVGEDGSGKVEEAMSWAASSGRVARYLSPFAAPIEIPGVQGVKVFVLGPPRDEDKLDDDDPRAGERFGTSMSRSLALGGLMADRLDATVASMARRGGKARAVSDWDRLTPFTPDHWVMKGRTHAADFPATYTRRGESWRRIDGAWATAAEELALWMDGHTNNTSLVLAIQLPKSGKVLLFAGDAQAGNWRSWHDRPIAAGDGVSVTARELLAKTILYKVSHHGSANATLNKLGLELMTHPDLSAMLPLFMEPLGKKWKMPATGLYEALVEKTRGRVIWADPNPPAEFMPDSPSMKSALGLPTAEWKKFQSEWKRFQKGLKQDALFVEHEISD